MRAALIFSSESRYGSVSAFMGARMRALACRRLNDRRASMSRPPSRPAQSRGCEFRVVRRSKTGITIGSGRQCRFTCDSTMSADLIQHPTRNASDAHARFRDASVFIAATPAPLSGRSRSPKPVRQALSAMLLLNVRRAVRFFAWLRNTNSIRIRRKTAFRLDAHGFVIR